MNAREQARFDNENAMTKVRQLDAFMHNFYKSNAERLGEWKTASHVETRQIKS